MTDFITKVKRVAQANKKTQDIKLDKIKDELRRSAMEGLSSKVLDVHPFWSEDRERHVQKVKECFTDIYIDTSSNELNFNWSTECTNEFGQTLRSIVNNVNKNKEAIEAWALEWSTKHTDEIKQKVLDDFTHGKECAQAQFDGVEFFSSDILGRYSAICLSDILQKQLCQNSKDLKIAVSFEGSDRINVWVSIAED